MLYISRWQVLAIVLTAAFLSLLATPNVLPQAWLDAMPGWLPKQTLNLGLDLRGGSYLLLEVKSEEVIRERQEGLLPDIRQRLRQQNIGYTNLGVSADTLDVSFRLRDPAQAEAALAALAEVPQPVATDVFGAVTAMDVTIRSAADGLIVISPTEAALTQVRQNAVRDSLEIVRRRIDALGTREPQIQQQGSERIIVQVPGLDNPAALKEVLGKTAKMTFHLVNENISRDDLAAGRVPPGTELLATADGAERIPIYRKVELAGDRLENAQGGFEQRTGRPIVQFDFDGAGARAFANITRENVGRRFAIVLDNQILTAPVINEPIIGGSGQISGNFTVEQTQNLSAMLRGGALPAPLEIIEERTVGETLGADAIAGGEYAVVAGFVLVFGLIVVVYGLFGVFACLALVINVAMILGILSALQATLTLPGIAGVVLTMGMAVDANVLIYERIREEMRSGKSVIASLDAGFSRALSAIIDANLTGLLGVALLFLLGSGPVRGFAVTLGIGIVTSMFTAIFVTRLMVLAWLRTKPKALPL